MSFGKKINDSLCLSILADETTDVFSNELCVWDIWLVKNNLCEDFLQFMKVDRLTGTSLLSAILMFNMYI